MDSINAAEKFQAMKNYKKCQFLNNNLILHSLTTLLCALFCSYPFWFPPLCSSGKHLLFVSLPNLMSSFFNPKCLFIVGNVIVAFLVGESKFANSQSSLATPIEGGFVDERSRTIHEVSNQMEKKEGEKLEGNEIEESVKKIIEDKYMAEKERGDHEEELVKDIEDDGDEYFDDAHDSHGNEFEEEERDEEEEEEEEEEEAGLPTEELTKRVEDFIARVNRQRWLEARLEDCGRG